MAWWPQASGGQPRRCDTCTLSSKRRSSLLSIEETSFATAALAARVPVEVVAARLGDTARVIQETYASVLPASDAAAAKAVGDLFRGGAGSSLWLARDDPVPPGQEPLPQISAVRSLTCRSTGRAERI